MIHLEERLSVLVLHTYSSLSQGPHPGVNGQTVPTGGAGPAAEESVYLKYHSAPASQAPFDFWVVE